MTSERPSRLGRHARRALALWLLGLAAISVWRGTMLWDTRALLAEVGSKLSPPWLGAMVALSICCGAGLAASAIGLWVGSSWGRWLTLVFLSSYCLVTQTYTWLFVQSGLQWERRWVSLTLAISAAGFGAGALLWPRSKRWLGLS